MDNKSKDFYVWTLEECIKDTYEWWGIDIMSMYGNIQESFPNAAQAIRSMYVNWNEEDFYEAKPVSFKQIHYVFQAIANLISLKETLKFDTKTKEQSVKYKGLNICSWDKFVSINRMDLLMAILLFTEEFIYYPITMGNVICTENKLIVYGTLTLLSKFQNIKIKLMFQLEYMMSCWSSILC